MPESTNIIQLPRLSALGALTLGEQLINAAKPHKNNLSPGLQKSLKRLTAAHGVIGEALRDQVAPGSITSNTLAAEHDRWEDSTWSGLKDALDGIAKLTRLPQAKEAAELSALLFTDGLKFVQLPYALQWAESETRLERIKDQKLQPRLEALGLGMFLSELKKAHTAYGQSLGISAPKPVEKEGKSIRAALDAFGDRLREYVLKVMGWVEPDEPETQSLADALLEPYWSWEVKAKSGGKSSEEPKAEGEGAGEG